MGQACLEKQTQQVVRVCVCVSACVSAYIHIQEGVFISWRHSVWKAGKSRICRMGQQAGDPGKKCCLSPKAFCRQNSFLLRAPQPFLLSPSTAWMRPTHTVEDNLLCSKATDLVKSRVMFHQIYGCCGPAKLIYKINHQRHPATLKCSLLTATSIII